MFLWRDFFFIFSGAEQTSSVARRQETEYFQWQLDKMPTAVHDLMCFSWAPWESVSDTQGLAQELKNTVEKDKILIDHTTFSRHSSQ